MAKQMTDIGLDDTEDRNIQTGDLTSTESTAQHQRQLLLNNKGDFKHNPTVCVGAFDYLDDEGMEDLIRAISIEFARDGMDVKNVQLMNDGTIETDAYYS